MLSWVLNLGPIPTFQEITSSQTSSKVFWLGLPLTTWGHGTTHGTCPLLGPQNAGCPACWPRRQGPCSRCDGWHESRTVPQSDQQLCRKLRDEGMAGMTEESLKNILGWFIQWFPCKSEICSPLTNQGFIHPSLRIAGEFHSACGLWQPFGQAIRMPSV